jgi:hypothetical protein
MQIIRVFFDETEPAESIARRIIRAFDPGEILCVKGKFFKVFNMKTVNETIQTNIVGNKYTLVLNIGEPAPVIIAPPAPVVSKVEEPEQLIKMVQTLPVAAIEFTKEPPKRLPPKSVEHKRAGSSKISHENPQKSLPIAGQVWQTKDLRRVDSPPFTVLSVNSKFAHTDKGARISLKRWRNYRLVKSC